MSEWKGIGYWYRDRIIFVTRGLGTTYGTFWRHRLVRRDGWGGMQRLASKYLPMVDDPAQAQADLDRWALNTHHYKASQELVDKARIGDSRPIPREY